MSSPTRVHHYYNRRRHQCHHRPPSSVIVVDVIDNNDVIVPVIVVVVIVFIIVLDVVVIVVVIVSWSSVNVTKRYRIPYFDRWHIRKSCLGRDSGRDIELHFRPHQLHFREHSERHGLPCSGKPRWDGDAVQIMQSSSIVQVTRDFQMIIMNDDDDDDDDDDACRLVSARFWWHPTILISEMFPTNLFYKGLPDVEVSLNQQNLFISVYLLKLRTLDNAW